MTDIPSRLKIGQLVYAVSEAEDIRRKDDDAYLFGHVSHEEQTIDIRALLCPTMKASALLHEIIHALFFQTGHFFDATDEERVCIALSFGLMQLLKDNPELVAYLLDDVEGIKVAQNGHLKDVVNE